MKQADLYNWSANISAPKFYPVSYISVDFGKTGAAAGVLTGIDPGWGETIGNFITGNKYKPAPEDVYIRYSSGENNFIYEGIVSLPKEKIRSIFREQSHPKQLPKIKKKQIEIFSSKEDHNGAEELSPKASTYFELIVGMAPGGWIRVWLRGNGDFDKVEIIKAQLKGHYDDTANERYKVKSFENWGKYYTYWQYHGIPYEVWANNEKEYNLQYICNNADPQFDYIIYQSISKDGTFINGFDFLNEREKANNKDFKKKKLPVQMTFSWHDMTKNIFYDTFVNFPKNFSSIFTRSYFDTNTKSYQNYRKLELEIEKAGNYGKVYLVGLNKRTLLFRFKANITKSGIVGSGDYSKEVHYFIP